MKSLSLNMKIAGILGILVLVSTFIAYKGIDDLGKVNDRLNGIVDGTAQKIRLGARINQNMLEISVAEKNIIMANTIEEMEQQKTIIEQKEKELKEKVELLRPLLDSENKAKMDRFVTNYQGYSDRVTDVTKLAMLNSNVKAKELSQGKARALFDKLEGSMGNLATTNESRFEKSSKVEDGKSALISARIIRNLVEAQRAEKNIILARTQDEMDQFAKLADLAIKSIKSKLVDLRKISNQSDRNVLDSFIKDFEEWQTVHNKVRSLSRENGNAKAIAISTTAGKEANNKARVELGAIVDFNDKQLDLDKVASDKNFKEARMALIITATVGILIALVLSILTMIGISRAIARVLSGLRDSSTQVSSASVQLSNAAQELSNMSNEQASSIEETSSSLEEMGGMIETNLNNTEEAVNMVKKVEDSSKEGNELMNSVENSMDQIHQANEKIKELVKVISNIGEKTQIMDEIVFQTKLLSFNASVEAERAGEHGRGFAVVAQEVGNLATMSGKAAQEIAVIVKDSIKQAEEITDENRKLVDKGVEYVKETVGKLKEIVEVSAVVSDKANQVLTASKEQSTGVRQITTAMNQLDKATQENAATAEETASTSEELSAQTELLTQIVKELNSVINGASASEKHVTKAVKKPTEKKEPKSDNVVSIKPKLNKSSKPADESPTQPEKMAVGAENVPLNSSNESDGWEQL